MESLIVSLKSVEAPGVSCIGWKRDTISTRYDTFLGLQHTIQGRYLNNEKLNSDIARLCLRLGRYWQNAGNDQIHITHARKIAVSYRKLSIRPRLQHPVHLSPHRSFL